MEGRKRTSSLRTRTFQAHSEMTWTEGLLGWLGASSSCLGSWGLVGGRLGQGGGKNMWEQEGKCVCGLYLGGAIGTSRCWGDRCVCVSACMCI